jgi:hypothetical protein
MLWGDQPAFSSAGGLGGIGTTKLAHSPAEPQAPPGPPITLGEQHASSKGGDAPLFAPIGRSATMPSNDPKELHPPVKYKPRPVARQMSKAEIKAAADRAEARLIRATTQPTDDPRNSPRAVGPAATKVIEG